MKHYALLVIGSGPAGHHAAIQAAKLGKSVAVVERRQMVGGMAVHTGTIPSKALREAVLYLSGFEQRGLYDVSYRVKKDIRIEDLMSRCDAVVRAETEVIRAQFERNDVELLLGHARFTGPHRVRIEGAAESGEAEADFIVIAAGSAPTRPAQVQFDDKTIIDSDGVFKLSTLPRTLTVVGAGVVGVEYACMFAVLGVKVTLVDGRARVLEFADGETIDALLYHMREIHGITVRLGEEVAEVRPADAGRVVCVLKSRKEIKSDCVLYSAGRTGSIAGLDLDKAGLQTDPRGRLKVNEHYQTAVSHIYAAGDVIGFPALASVAMEQGRLSACHAFANACTSVPALFPFALFTIPGVSMVGKTEEQLTAETVPYETGIAHYREIARGQIIGDRTGLLKLLFHRQTRKLLGVHILGQGAAELVHIGQAVMAFDGTIDFFVNNVFNYPTLAECYKVAALNALNKLTL